jgi:hypothetical protein
MYIGKLVMLIFVSIYSFFLCRFFNLQIKTEKQKKNLFPIFLPNNMERDPNQSWLDDVNMQLGLSYPYPTPIPIPEQ